MSVFVVLTSISSSTHDRAPIDSVTEADVIRKTLLAVDEVLDAGILVPGWAQRIDLRSGNSKSESHEGEDHDESRDPHDVVWGRNRSKSCVVCVCVLMGTHVSKMGKVEGAGDQGKWKSRIAGASFRVTDLSAASEAIMRSFG